MNTFHALFLGTIQGITEFLPISSSGHLVFFEDILGLHVEELLPFDVALHLGSVVAIVLYFWLAWKKLFFDTVQSLSSWKSFKQSDAIKLIIATIPAVIAGLLWKDILEEYLRNILSVSMFWVILGIILIIPIQAKLTDSLTHTKALCIGLAQSFALIPGISRSGSTILTAMHLGISRKRAAEFSFFMGVIAILGGSVLTFFKNHSQFVWGELGGIYFVGFIASFVSSLISIHYLMKILQSNRLHYLSYYLFGMAFLGYIWYIFAW